MRELTTDTNTAMYTLTALHLCTLAELLHYRPFVYRTIRHPQFQSNPTPSLLIQRRQSIQPGTSGHGALIYNPSAIHLFRAARRHRAFLSIDPLALRPGPTGPTIRCH